jgi:hypothetical protein
VDLVTSFHSFLSISDQQLPAILRTLARKLHQFQIRQQVPLQVITRGGPGWRIFFAFWFYSHTGKSDCRHQVARGHVSPPSAFPQGRCGSQQRSGAHWAAWRRYVFTTRSSPRTTAHQPIRSPGKTIFLNFILARLISARQVVLVYDGTRLRLFLPGQSILSSGGVRFRYSSSRSKHTILSHMDVDRRRQPEPRATYPNGIKSLADPDVLPGPPSMEVVAEAVQRCSVGVPLWDMEELMEGYVFSLLSLSAIDPGHVVR